MKPADWGNKMWQWSWAKSLSRKPRTRRAEELQEDASPFNLCVDFYTFCTAGKATFCGLQDPFSWDACRWNEEAFCWAHPCSLINTFLHEGIPKSGRGLWVLNYLIIGNSTVSVVLNSGWHPVLCLGFLSIPFSMRVRNNLLLDLLSWSNKEG